MNPKQALFLLLQNRDAFYGGAGGGGKSWALLAGALQYVDIPGYNAILFRKTLTDLQQPESLMSRSHEWLDSTDASWDNELYRWTFPSGATLSFGYINHDKDKLKYQGAAYQYVGFDELTQFEEKPVLYLFSRMRRLMGYPVPIRFRAAANPGGPGHDWVKARYIDQDWKQTGRIYIPATLYDNAFIDQDEYRISLDNLDPLTREQILNGDWEVRPDTLYFKREMLKVVNSVPEYMYHQERKRFVRFWDLASTERSLKNKDPDYTCGVLMMEAGGQFLIIDVQRFRQSPSEVEARIKTTAIEDRENFGSVSIYIEEEPGASGVSSVDHYIRNVLKGFIVEPFKTGGRNKQKRARPFASAAKNGNVFIMRSDWNPDFIKELEVFPQEAASIHDDQVDAASGAHHCLVNLMITGKTFTNYDPAYLPNSLTSATPTQVRDEVQKRFHKPQQRFWAGAGRFHGR